MRSRIESSSAQHWVRSPRGRRPRLAALLLAVLVLVGCASGGDQLSAADATECRELGGGLVYLRYERADGSTEIRVQPGIRHEQAQRSPGLSPEAREVLEIRGWDDEALEELQSEQALSPEISAMLDAAPSCLEELQDGRAGGPDRSW